MIIISLDSIIYNYTAKTNAIFAKNVVIEKIYKFCNCSAIILGNRI